MTTEIDAEGPAKAAKLINVQFTAEELYELDCLLANGVCDYSDPSNKVAASAYEKISRASRKRTLAARGSAKL
jgi:hypothetical protein